MGDGLFPKVQDGFAFLSYVWDPGDEVFIFGFSRGAYTARSLAGMLAAFGVPTRNLDNQTVLRLFAAYRTTDPDQRAALKAQLTDEYGLEDVTVKMIGVWDTVGALGVPGHLFDDFDQAKYGFLDTSLSSCIEKAFHAVSIDERRASFVPTLWTNKDGSPRENDHQLQQVWFPGVHCDVGGSYKDCALSQITLHWMINNAKSCGLEFDEEVVNKCLDPKPFDASGPAHDEWKLIPWGLAKQRTVPDEAVLANTVLRRTIAAGPYRPTNLRQPPERYRTLEVAAPDELK